jgi:Sulfotransferase family
MPARYRLPVGASAPELGDRTMPEILDLPARHRRRAPVFVIGTARSGTSLLCTLLRRYLQLSFGTESQFIVRVYRQLPTYGDLRDERNLRALVEAIARERCFERWTRRFGFVLDANAVFEAARGGRPGYAGVLDAIFSQFARYHGMDRWGDKTPEYNYNLPVLLSLFPQAQFVHIVRDGRDVALSTLRMGFGGANIYRVGVAWRRQLLLIQQFLSPLPPDQSVTLRYEQLLSEPVGTLRRLADVLGVEDDPRLMPAIAGDITSQVRSDNGGKWQAQMPRRQQALFEAVAGDQLRAYGYETVHEPHAPLAASTRLYWEADHLVRKTIKPQYWSDHVYRARVRLGMTRPSGPAAARPASSAVGH